MTCKCGCEVLDQKGAYFCISCGKHCVHCVCAALPDVPVPDTLVPIPHGLLLWSDR